eukprot:5603290-Pyramimonas_sp.AAC.1
MTLSSSSSRLAISVTPWLSYGRFRASSLFAVGIFGRIVCHACFLVSPVPARNLDACARSPCNSMLADRLSEPNSRRLRRRGSRF